MATNIYNPKTGQQGYQVPGSALMPGWEWSIPSQIATAVQPKSEVSMLSTDKAIPALNTATDEQNKDLEALSTEEKNRKINEENAKKKIEDATRKQGGMTAEEITAAGGDLGQYDYVQSAGLYLPKSATPAEDTYKKDEDELNQVFSAQQGLIDQSTSNLMSSINNIYGQLISEQKDYNKMSERNLGSSLMRAGLTRYAPEATAGILSVNARENLKKLTDIATKQASALAEAEQARSDKSYELFVKKREEIKGLRKERTDALKALQEEAQKQRTALVERKRIANRDGAIAELLNTGTTDRKEMLTKLNQAGVYVSAKELEDTIKSLAPEANGDLEKLTGDAKDYYILKNIPGALPANIKNVFDYIRAKAVAGKTTSTDGISGYPTGIAGMSDDTSKAISLAVAGLKFTTQGDRKDAEATIRQLLLEGDMEGAKAQLQNYAYNSASATQQDVLDGKKMTLLALDRIESDLNKFVAKGGKTDFFTGLSQKVLEKGGLVYNKDMPELNEIANDIAVAIMDYRRAISGAAFTESEARAYQGVFPSTGNTPELNEAKINSLRNKLQADTEQFTKNKIGDLKYNKIFGATAEITPAKPAQDQVKEIYQANPSMQAMIDELVNQNYSWDDILQVLTTQLEE